MTYFSLTLATLCLVGVAMSVWGTVQFVLLRGAHNRHTHPGSVALPQNLAIGVVLVVVSLLSAWIGDIWL